MHYEIDNIWESKREYTIFFVGSVKSNIGHLECAAEIDGLIIAIFIWMNERVPSNTGLKALNPLIESLTITHNFPVKCSSESTLHSKIVLTNTFNAQ